MRLRGVDHGQIVLGLHVSGDAVAGSEDEAAVLPDVVNELRSFLSDLFGSSLAKSTGAAAGIGVGISALILLVSSLPNVGALAPGGLVAWATQIGAGTATTPNGGTIATSIVISLMFIISSLGVIEQQEI